MIVDVTLRSPKIQNGELDLQNNFKKFAASMNDDDSLKREVNMLRNF